MANWCYNVAQFQGDVQKINELKELFASLCMRPSYPAQGQLPEFIQTGTGYFFDIEIEEDTIRYETKWAPNLAELQIVADHFKLSFELFYHELANGVYGEAHYQNGALEDFALEQEDFDKVSYNEEQNFYLFEGAQYESEFEVYDILLERKKQGLDPNQNHGHEKETA